MSYYRPIRLDELIAWLDARDYDEEPKVVAQALLEAFDILLTSATPT